MNECRSLLPSYLLLTRDGGELLEMCSLHRRGGPGCIIELGYWLTEAAVGHGHVTSAAHALTTASLAFPDIDRVEIHCDEASVRSRSDVAPPVSGLDDRRW